MKFDQIDCRTVKIIIVGPRTPQNEFLCSEITKEMGIVCLIRDGGLISVFEYGLPGKDESGGKKLILIDTENPNFEEILEDISTNRSLSGCYISLLNLKEDSGLEKKALTRNIRGFFYKDDQFEVYLKGIRAILSGDLWISRSVFLKCVFDTFKDNRKAVGGKRS